MEKKKIIPCLDIAGGRVVKGVNFVNLKDVGDPLEVALAYQEQGADELVFLDINATVENRGNMLDVLERSKGMIKIPIAVGGGIRNIEDFKNILNAGATKVSVNSAALENKNIIAEASKLFGKGAVVVAIDVRKKADGTYGVVTHGGQRFADVDAVWWAKEVESLGAGEILLTSMDGDGAQTGYDLEITGKIAAAVSIPVTASGGCGSLEHFKEVFEKTDASAALAASLFHFGTLTVPQVKAYLKEHNIEVEI